MDPSSPTAALRSFRGIDAPEAWVGSKSNLWPEDARRFDGRNLAHAIARELCARRFLPVKELFEAFEVFALARKTLRAPVVVDACCGHGLGGLVFAAMEREVERVVLVDRTRPPSAEATLEAVGAAAPWALEKVEWREELLRDVDAPPGASVLAIHACGLRTDAALDLAVRAGGSFAALPCCRPHRQHPAPQSLKNALGPDVAIDVHRTYALENAGYVASWKQISPAITPMNRLLIGRAPRASQ